MSITETVFIAVVLSVAPALAAALGSVLVSLLICSALVVSDRDLVSRFDQTAGRGWCQRRAVETQLPTDGWHLVWLTPGSWPVVARRETNPGAGHKPTLITTWTVYARDPAAATRAITQPDPDGEIVRVVQFEQPAAYHTATTVTSAPVPDQPREWQRAALVAIAQAVAAVKSGRPRRHASVLVCGPPGAGKSALCKLVAVQLRADGVVPSVVRGFRLDAAGAVLSDAIRHGELLSRHRPKVIEFAEYDVAVRRAAHRAEKEGGVREGSAIADTKTGLVACLDFAADLADLVVVATTNLAPEELAALADPAADPAAPPAPGTGWADRAGRFDIRIWITSSGEFEIVTEFDKK